ncbi:MAG: hypothetical protein KAV00_06350 [Phycisphaerae bacterium]|nr:hypothetical protein [Phycisphaerae bacterium]
MKRNAKLAVLVCLMVTATVLVGYAVAQERGPHHSDSKWLPPGSPHKPEPGQILEIKKISEFTGAMGHLTRMCFDSETIGVMAVGALKDDIRRKDEAIIKDLEEQLAKVKTQGLRNAIRLTLKDIYKRQGENEKVIAHIKALIAENDKALRTEKKK